MASTLWRAWGKSLLLGIGIGCLTGVGVVVFVQAIAWCAVVCFGVVGGAALPDAIEAGLATPSTARPLWLLPVVLSIGGLLSGILSTYGASDAREPSFAIIGAAVTRQDSAIAPRVMFVKTLAALATLGSGASVGRGGPDALIGAGIGSWLAHVVWPHDARLRRLAVIAGAGAGLAAIFKAPLGGALFAIEIFSAGEIGIAIAAVILAASCASYSVFCFFQGTAPLLRLAAPLASNDPLGYLVYAAVGLGAGAVAWIYPWALQQCAGWFQALAKRFLRRVASYPALGGLVVGLFGMALPPVLGSGFGWTQLALTGDVAYLAGSLPGGLARLSWLALLVLLLAKIGATALTLGSGGSGGILGPGFVMGSIVSLTLWYVGHALLPFVFTDALLAGSVVVGMGAFMGGITRAPFASAMLVCEIVADRGFLPPVLLATLFAWAIAASYRRRWLSQAVTLIPVFDEP